MNLKESFRYLNFLDKMLESARMSVNDPSHCLKTTRTHLRNAANPEAKDVVEVVEVDDFFETDTVIKFMTYLIQIKQALTEAIGYAKKVRVPFDIDAAIATNKYRQNVCSTLRYVQKYTPSKKTERATDYKFNAEGNQVAYYYDVEVSKELAYDRYAAKRTMKDIIREADETSAKIDAAMISTTVDFEEPFDVNDTFEDVMTEFIDTLPDEN